MSRKRRRKPVPAGKTAKTATKTAMPALVVPPHGNGALLTGGVPGNAGGPGRPPSAVKATAREAFDKRIPLLETFADSVEVPVKERRLAIVALGTFGLKETRVSVEWVKEKLAETLTILRETLPPDRYMETMAQLKAVWKESA